MASWFVPSHVVLDETITLKPADPTSLTYAPLSGYLPLIFGTITLLSTEANEPLSMHVKVYGTALLCMHSTDERHADKLVKEHIRLRQRGGDVALGVGGLSLCQSLRLFRIQVDVTIRIPQSTTRLSIASGPLSVRVQSAHMPKGTLTVAALEGSTIAVEQVTAHRLNVSTQAGSLIFNSKGDVEVADTIEAMTKSGHLNAHGALYAQTIRFTSVQSGSMDVRCSTNASQVSLATRSGHLGADVAFSGTAGKICISNFSSRSGAMHVKLHHWSGLILADSQSGAVSVRGVDVHKSHPGTGWRLGVEDAKAICSSRSGAITVEASAD